MAAIDKPRLRAEMRRKRRDLVAIRGARVAIRAPFAAILARIGTLAAYMPMPGEADPHALIAAARAAGWRIALPHVAGRGAPMRFLDWPADRPLHAGAFGLLQPDASAPAIAPDAVLTPLVAFDRRGNRLGQGAGFYDRAFADHPRAMRIGVALSVQEADAVPVDPWDVPLHAIITEREWIEP